MSQDLKLKKRNMMGDLEGAHSLICGAAGVIVGMIIHRKYRAAFKETAIRQLTSAVEILKELP